MSEDQKRFFSPVDGVSLWIEQGSSIHLKSIAAFGDPVELTAEEARQIAKALQDLADAIEL